MNFYPYAYKGIQWNKLTALSIFWQHSWGEEMEENRDEGIQKLNDWAKPGQRMNTDASLSVESVCTAKLTL